MYLALVVLAAYLIGSLCGSLILGRLVGVDIRQSGSGNAGGTNALRTLGWKYALSVALVDVGKGVLAALFPGWFGVPPDLLPLAQAACVLTATVGHTWPVFFGFRGGKGAATLVGGLAVIWPLALVVVFAVWLLALLATGYVGLSTVLAAVALLPFAIFDVGDFPALRLSFAIAAASFIVFTHRANLRRLLQGNEYRFEGARLFTRRRRN